MEHLFKLKKDGKTVGYLKIADRAIWFRDVWSEVWDIYQDCGYIDFDTAHPFVTKDKNGKDVFAGDKIRQEREDSFPKYNTGEVVYDENRGQFLVNYFKKIPQNSFLRKLASGHDIITDESGDYMFANLTGWPFELIEEE